jgi:hypothetical protein
MTIPTWPPETVEKMEREEKAALERLRGKKMEREKEKEQENDKRIFS